MLKWQKLILGDLQTNCYLVWNEKKEAIVIDAAEAGVEEEIERLGLKPKMVVATHGHFDHLLGALDLKLIYDIPFGCSQKDWFLLRRTQQTARHFLARQIKTPNFDKIDVGLDKEKEVLGLKIIKTPGHTPGSLSFWGDNLLFCGDTIFSDGIGRTDFSYSSAVELEKSIQRLLRLPGETWVLPGHGEEFVLGQRLA